MLAALTSGFIALSALGASIYNVYLQRRQIEAQVWPHLEFMHSNPEPDEFTFDLQNTGVGPARIQGVRIAIRGKACANWNEVFHEAGEADPELKALITNPGLHYGYSSVAQRVLGAGVVIHPGSFHWAAKNGEAPPSMMPLVRLFESADVSICYCSTLDDCEMDGEPVKRCPLEQLTFKQ